MRLTEPSDRSWPKPSTWPSLETSEVHVWRAGLNLPRPDILRLRRTLSADELARARRFHFNADRDCFVAARGALRDILSGYLGTEARYLRFEVNPHGKPTLVPLTDNGRLTGSWGDGLPGDSTPLQFNLSHSDGLALVAVARGRRVGVDVERMRTDLERDLIAARSFSPQERAQLRSLPSYLQAEGFYNCWTRKEAYLKARGEGLSLPLDCFSVSLIPGEPSVLLDAAEVRDDESRWLLADLRPAPGYVAALAVEGDDCRLACWQW